MTGGRIGLLADVHANLPALRSALEALRRAEVETIVVAGDLVGYGASPDACVELLASTGAVCVAGNHDLLFVDRLPPTRFPTVARRAAEVTGATLGADTRRYLERLPTVRSLGRLLVAHGSPDDPEEYVEDRVRGRALLADLARRAADADVLVLGHTHRTWQLTGPRAARTGRRTQLVNPGGVGQSRDAERRPRVRAALFDLGADRFLPFTVDYDVEAAADALGRLGLSRLNLHHPPTTPARIARRLPPPVRGVARRLWHAGRAAA